MRTPSWREELLAWRQRLGLTQAQAAAALSVAPRTLQGWESQSEAHTPKHVEAIRSLMREVEKRRKK